jgi:hypothetical protein
MPPMGAMEMHRHMTEVVKTVKGANCKDCATRGTCNYIKEGFGDCVLSLKCGYSVNCADYVKERRDIFDIMTDAEITKLKQTHNCPICGFEFVGYPTGWAWE